MFNTFVFLHYVFAGGAGVRVKGKDAGEQIEPSASFLRVLTKVCDYMYKISSTQRELIEGFRILSLYGAIGGEVKVVSSDVGAAQAGQNKQKRITLRGFKPLRKLAKNMLYRYAQLKARKSDPDFASDTEAVGDPQAQNISQEQKREVLSNKVVELGDLAAKVKLVLDAEKPFDVPVLASIGAAKALNTVMMGLFAEQAERGGHLESTDKALSSLIQRALTAVADVFPADMDTIAELVDDLRDLTPSDGAPIATPDTPLGGLIATRFSASTLVSMRIQLFSHIIAALGGQLFNLKTGDSPVPTSSRFVSGTVQAACSGLLELNKVHQNNAVPDNLRELVQLFTEKNKTWVDFIQLFVRTAVDEDARGERHDDAEHFALRGKLQEAMASASQVRYGWPPVLTHYGLNPEVMMRHFDAAKIELFPTEKQAAVKLCVNAYDEMHPEEVRRADFKLLPCSTVFTLMRKALVPQPQVQNVAEAAAAIEEEDASQPEKKRRLMSVGEWWTEVGQAEDQTLDVPHWKKREILARISLYFSELAAKTYISKPDGEFWGVYLVRDSVELKNKKVTLERSGAGDVRFL